MDSDDFEEVSEEEEEPSDDESDEEEESDFEEPPKNKQPQRKHKGRHQRLSSHMFNNTQEDYNSDLEQSMQDKYREQQQMVEQ